MSGQAVHAVAGHRSKYEPVVSGGKMMGDPIQLLDRYAALGLNQVYVADLDGIMNQSPDLGTLNAIAKSTHQWKRILVDIGWRDGVNLN